MDTNTKPAQNFWKRRTVFERRLMVLLVILLVGCIVLLFWPCKTEEPTSCPVQKCPKTKKTFAPKPIQTDKQTNEIGDTSDEDDDEDVCLTPECLKTSLDILQSIDASADPCEDYYQFFCGNFMENAYETRIASPVIQEFHRLKRQMYALLESPISENDSEALVLEKRFLQACMDLDAIDDDYDVTFINLIDQMDWPVLEPEWEEDNFDWVQLMVEARHLGLPFDWFLSIGTFPVNMNSFYISHPRNVTELDDSSKREYLDTMIDIVVSLNGSREAAEDQLDDVLEFHQKLAKICPENETDDTVILKSLKEFKESVPLKIDWFELITNLTDDDNDEDNDTEITAESEIAFHLNSYLYDLAELLKETPKRVLANYIGWKITESFAPFLSKSIRERYTKYQDIEDDDCDETRFEFCFEDTIERFNFVAEAEYIRKYTDAKTKEVVQQIIELVKDDLVERINESDWMDDVTKAYNLNKLLNIRSTIGGQEEIFDEEKFDRYLLIKNLNFSSSNVIEMITEKRDAYFDALFDSMDDYAIRTERSGMYKKNVNINAHYDNLMNTIILPAAVLQGKFFSLNVPNYLNYGSLAVLTGHEIMHGFGKKTSKIEINDDTTFNIWTNETIEEFANASQCIIDEYENFNSGLSLDFELSGEKTFEENYADFIGMDMAYEAYQKWVEENGEEPKLPGLSYDQNQLFWIKWGTLMCHQKLLDSKPDLDSEDVHAISRFRIWGPMRNSDGFAEDFKCPKGSDMNPEEKCQVL